MDGDLIWLTGEKDPEGEQELQKRKDGWCVVLKQEITCIVVQHYTCHLLCTAENGADSDLIRCKRIWVEGNLCTNAFGPFPLNIKKLLTLPLTLKFHFFLSKFHISKIFQNMFVSCGLTCLLYLILFLNWFSCMFLFSFMFFVFSYVFAFYVFVWIKF